MLPSDSTHTLTAKHWAYMESAQHTVRNLNKKRWQMYTKVSKWRQRRLIRIDSLKPTITCNKLLRWTLFEKSDTTILLTERWCSLKLNRPNSQDYRQRSSTKKWSIKSSAKFNPRRFRKHVVQSLTCLLVALECPLSKRTRWRPLCRKFCSQIRKFMSLSQLTRESVNCALPTATFWASLTVTLTRS